MTRATRFVAFEQETIMSWSIRYAGTKEESLKNIRSQAAGLPYKPGTLEGDDVVAAVARIEALAESPSVKKIIVSSPRPELSV